MKLIPIAAGLLSLGLTSMVHASQLGYSVVDSHHCALMKGSQQTFILALRKGEQVQQAILHCAIDAELQGATLTGLGAFKPTTLRYFDHVAKQYHDKAIPDFMEVTNLTGNISLVNGQLSNHIHVTLSNHDFVPQAGHLKDATVGAVLEVKITPMPYKVEKTFDKEVGLDILVSP